ARARGRVLGDVDRVQPEAGFGRPDAACGPRILAGLRATPCGGEAAVDQSEFNSYVSLGEGSLAIADRLHLGAGEHEARLDRVRDGVVVPRTPILDRRAVVLFRAGFAL